MQSDLELLKKSMSVSCKRVTCVSYQKDMSVVVDTCVIWNVIGSVINFMEENGYPEDVKFEIFCGILKRYLKKMRLCPMNQKLFTTVNIYDNEMDLSNPACSLREVSGLKNMCDDDNIRYNIIKELLESYISINKRHIKKTEIQDFRMYIKNHYERQKEISDNDISLVILAMKLQNENGELVLTDDIKVIEMVNIVRSRRRYRYNNGNLDTTLLYGLTSLYYFGNLYFCCELYRSYYIQLFKIRGEHINDVINSVEIPNPAYKGDIDNASRILARIDKLW